MEAVGLALREHRTGIEVKRYQELTIHELLTQPKSTPTRRCNACNRVYPNACGPQCPWRMVGLCTDCAVLEYRISKISPEQQTAIIEDAIKTVILRYYERDDGG